MTKILVTGGAGFIGSALVRMMLRRGFEVVNVDCLTYASNLKNLGEVLPHDGYFFEKVNICDFPEISRIFKEHQPDAVLHLAAESHVDRSIDAPGEFIQTNIQGTYTLLENALNYASSLPEERAYAFRFLHVSTDEVYGDLNSTDPAFTEKTPYNPSSPYSASKAASDHLARAWHRTFKLPVLITNCSNNYGPYQFPEKLIPVVINKIINRHPIPIYGTGENVRDWLFVDDHADAILTVLDKGKIGETYNVGGNSESTNIDLVKCLCRIMDELDPGEKPHESLISFVTDRPGHDRRYAINAEKIRKDTGWEPQKVLTEALRETVVWYLENKAIWEPLLPEGRLGLKNAHTS